MRHRGLAAVAGVLVATAGAAVADEDDGGWSFGSDGLTWTAPDNDVSLRIGGDLMLDGIAGSRRDGEVRRARLVLEGSFGDDLTAVFEWDAAEPDAPVADAFLRHSGLAPFDLQAGHFEEPFGLENLGALPDNVFLERGLPEALQPGRALGLGARHAADGWTARLGLFGRGWEQRGTAVGGRVTYAPQRDEGRVLHLGLAFNLRDPDGAAQRLRPEAQAIGLELLDSGVLADVSRIDRLGLEFAATRGPFAVQSEYMRAVLRRPGRDAGVHAAYAFLAWTVTGEARRYDSDEGLFERLRPERPVTDGGLGAVELALRYAVADLDGGGLDGGRQQSLSLGANWHLTRNLALRANAVRAWSGDDVARIVQARLQLAF